MGNIFNIESTGAMEAQARHEAAAEQEERLQANAEHTLDMILSGDDKAGFTALFEEFHACASLEDLELLDSVLFEALRAVKEREDSSRASLYDRLVNFIREQD